MDSTPVRLIIRQQTAPDNPTAPRGRVRAVEIRSAELTAEAFSAADAGEKDFARA
jgi:hypothetical protein